MAATEWWTSHDSWSMAGWVFGGFCLIVAWKAAERCQMWRKRCRDRDRTIAKLRDALNDARYCVSERRPVPASVREWQDTPPPVKARRASVWPGVNPKPLPVAYGPAVERLETDPCLTQPDEYDLDAWINEPQAPTWPLDVEGICIERVLTALEHLEPTAQMWVVPHLQETQ